MDSTRTSVQPQLLKSILRDAWELYQAGRREEALERVYAALSEHRAKARIRPIGARLTVDVIADDFAKVLGVRREVCRAIAREALIESPPLVVARELSELRQEVCR